MSTSPSNPNEIFVFGSNLAGRHGAGSALRAVKDFGAIYGIGRGLQGRAYALPTKDRFLRSLSLNVIRLYVLEFLAFAEAHPTLQFNVVAVGCGLAGYPPEQIAPMFLGAGSNVVLPQVFRDVLTSLRTK